MIVLSEEQRYDTTPFALAVIDDPTKCGIDFRMGLCDWLQEQGYKGDDYQQSLLKPHDVYIFYRRPLADVFNVPHYVAYAASPGKSGQIFDQITIGEVPSQSLRFGHFDRCRDCGEEDPHYFVWGVLHGWVCHMCLQYEGLNDPEMLEPYFSKE